MEQFQNGFADMKWLEAKSGQRAAAAREISDKTLVPFDADSIDGLDEFGDVQSGSGISQAISDR